METNNTLLVLSKLCYNYSSPAIVVRKISINFGDLITKLIETNSTEVTSIYFGIGKSILNSRLNELFPNKGYRVRWRTYFLSLLDSKLCPKCNTIKLHKEFNNNSFNESNISSNCKSCSSEKGSSWYEANTELCKNQRRIRYLNNRDKELEQSKEYYYTHIDQKSEWGKLYYKTNAERILNRQRLFRLSNLELLNNRTRQFRLSNPGLCASYSAKYRANKLNATPIWSETDLIKEFYKKCPKGYHVDHDYPLQSGIVCGLHVLANLRYLTISENCSKSNKFTNQYLEYND